MLSMKTSSEHGMLIVRFKSTPSFDIPREVSQLPSAEILFSGQFLR